jgi:hypothetical protein
MALAARPQLGVEVLGTAEAKYLLEKAHIAGEENEAVAVTRQEGGQTDGRAPPMYLRHRAAECAPSTFVKRERNGLLPTRNQMPTENGPNTHGGTGALELHGAVYTVGVGAGQSMEPLPGRCLSECFGAGNADSEGEVGVDVEVGHLKTVSGNAYAFFKNSSMI